MLAAEQQLAETFARMACEVLIGQVGVEQAYREISALFAAADEDLRQMYMEIIAVMELVRSGARG
ncbi:hypothetical protein [Aureimonas leprariae]|uniref:Uncharacterized protein n=1 Tax=Plantimonas leprariae TaxID=2615207 RepID=A0A7V7TVK5_9HYPH|nr:hypothetical protein [Aureimonas leprariae]KAB0677734.1 hypothetical protein F6X38_17270 [Aureimonas leprariae]